MDATLLTILASLAAAAPDAPPAVTIRVAAWHLPGLRTAELMNPDAPRARAVAETLQRLRPNVVVLSGLAYDVAGAPGVRKEAQEGQNAQRLVDGFLLTPQADGLEPLPMRAFFPPTNSGQPSGLDLDRSGAVVTSFPMDPSKPGKDWVPGAYSGDCWGPGEFPGQWGVAVLVDPRLEALTAEARTFRLMPWDYVPSASLPPGPDGTGQWFTDEQRKVVRLSSTTALDLPVRLPHGAVLNVLGGHATEPGLVDDQRRRARRNRDEVRFWADYVEGQPYLVDDAGRGGGLDEGSSFVILANLGVAPEDERGLRDPVGQVLFSSGRINTRVVPRDGDSDATRRTGGRTTYLLPSRDLGVAAAGVWRHPPTVSGTAPAGGGGSGGFPGEHYPVWMDVVVRAPAGR